MYIEQRRRRWYAVLDIPEAVRPTFDKKRFVQSLQTESKSVAERRALPLIADWKTQIEQARKGKPLASDVQYWREAFKNTPDEVDEDYASDGMPGLTDRDLLRHHLYEMSQEMDKKSKGSGNQFFQRVTGKTTGTTEYLEQWIGGLNNERKTIDMKEAAVRKLAKQFSSIQDINKRAIQLWAHEQVSEAGLHPKTVLRDVSFLRQYWEYLQTMEVASIDDYPFEKIRISENKKEAMRARRRAFTAKQVVGLLTAAQERKDQQLCDLITLGMWTGARIDELCALEVSKVTEKSFVIEDAKTQSGWREVPIHSKLKPTMDRLLKDSADGFVLCGLSADNKYNKRSAGIGKRFGRMKTELGYRKKIEVFHSIRKTVLTLLKNAGVPEVTAADIVGHDKPTLTYGLYPGDPDFEVVKDAIEVLDYPN